MRGLSAWISSFVACLALLVGVLTTPGMVFAESPSSKMTATGCSVSLQARVDAAPPGSTVQAEPCIYRETVTITRPLTLVGVSGTEIRGSDVWSNWRHTGAYWLKGPLPVSGGQNGQCAPGRDCEPVEQVFIDGRPSVRVVAAPGSGQFAIDKDRNVVLADDPTHRLVEVSTRAAWVVIRSDNVTIDGLTMQHAANEAQRGALIADGASHVTVRNSTLAYAHGVNVQFLNGADDQLLDSDIHHAGQLGVSAYQTNGFVANSNSIHDNNTSGYDPFWEAGGLKLTASSDAQIEANEVYANAGQGLWCDINCQNVTYARNRVHDNSHLGIVFEISNGGSIVDNAVWNNASAIREGWSADIFISSSSNVEVANNTALATAAYGILVASQDRADAPGRRAVVNVAVHDNTIAMNQLAGSSGRLAVEWVQDWQGGLFAPEANNRGYNNASWFSDGSDPRDAALAEANIPPIA